MRDVFLYLLDAVMGLALDVPIVLPREAQINLRLLLDLLPSSFTPDLQIHYKQLDFPHQMQHFQCWGVGDVIVVGSN